MIYLHLEQRGVIYLLYVYDKGEAEDLTAGQKKTLKTIAEAIKREYRT